MSNPEKVQAVRKGTKARPGRGPERPRSQPPERGKPRVQRRRPPPPPELVPVMSGRFYWAMGLIAAAAIVPFWSGLGQAMAPKDPPGTDMSGWRTGNTSSFRITLITADVNLLSCASDAALEGKHCEFKDNKSRWPLLPGEPIDDNRRNQIQPYRTWPDNKLVLVAGLWAEPHVAMRLHREPPRGVADKKLARFVADCRMRFIGEIDSPKLRWNPTAEFMEERAKVPVAVAEFCNVVTEF
jgi:hypothetical protein